MLKKGAIIENLEITSFSVDGQSECKIEDQIFVVDAKSAGLGDIVEVEILSMKNGLARVRKITQFASTRPENLCRHFGVCGGCSWQHTPYSSQVEQKKHMVERALTSIYEGRVEIIASPREFYYRNKLEYSASNQVWRDEKPKFGEVQPEISGLGYYVPRAGFKIVDIEDCKHQIDPSNDIRNWFRNYLSINNIPIYNSKLHTGIFRTLLIRSTKAGSFLVMPIFAAEFPEMHDCLKALVESFPELSSVYYCINPKKNDSYSDLEPNLFYGSAYLKEHLGGFNFRIGPRSFMQVNPWQTEALYDLVLTLAAPHKDDLAYDLYCGAGTISAWLSKKAKKVIGIEIIPEAISAANEMATENQIGNCHFFVGDVKDLIKKQEIQDFGRPRIIVLDPPRAGLHPSVIQAVRELAPEIIVYVSCKLTSLLPDLNKLLDKYKIDEVHAVDLMPQTHHIETVVKLVKKL